MGFISWLRERALRTPSRNQAGRVRQAAIASRNVERRPTAKTTQREPWPGEGWEELPAYLPVDPAEHMTACIVASAIAAGDAPQSSFKVKSVSVTNPEYRRVACIATALGAGALESSQFTIKHIYKQKTMGDSNAA